MWKTMALHFAGLAVAAALAQEQSPKSSTYKVAKLREAPVIDAKWDKAPWKDVKPLDVAQFMGRKPEHLPLTQAKVAYDDEAVYVIFKVEDRYVRAVAESNQSSVCLDSCVEFFFAPGNDVTAGYFNLEMNCGGTMLLNFQKVPRKDARPLPEKALNEVKVAHSLPKIVEPEITEPTVWTVEYRLPLAILGEHCPVTKPAPGVVWRANFYKCADKTSHPHWLTWSFIDRPRPDFHVPKDFGVLEFE
ncbi:MAG: carbohydrate-binding family 9-like protein [Planctomycetota bacterium]|nr:carbohydrate-binding family 9-like protein [Planctomycetota bacterium]